MLNNNRKPKKKGNYFRKIISRIILSPILIDLVNDLVPELLGNLFEQIDIIPSKECHVILVIICIAIKFNLIFKSTKNEAKEK